MRVFLASAPPFSGTWMVDGGILTSTDITLTVDDNIRMVGDGTLTSTRGT
jgi:hypothetical protein